MTQQTETNLPLQDLERLTKEVIIMRLELAAFKYYEMNERDKPLIDTFKEILRSM